jgi:hypothetical protein
MIYFTCVSARFLRQQLWGEIERNLPPAGTFQPPKQEAKTTVFCSHQPIIRFIQEGTMIPHISVFVNREHNILGLTNTSIFHHAHKLFPGKELADFSLCKKHVAFSEHTDRKDQDHNPIAKKNFRCSIKYPPSRHDRTLLLSAIVLQRQSRGFLQRGTTKPIGW